MVEGERVEIRYWIDLRTHIFESQVLLNCFKSEKEGYNLRWKVKKKNQKQHSRFTTTLFFFFFVFRVGVLLRNFALEPIRFPQFLDVGFLH